MLIKGKFDVYLGFSNRLSIPAPVHFSIRAIIPHPSSGGAHILTYLDFPCTCFGSIKGRRQVIFRKKCLFTLKMNDVINRGPEG